MIGFNYVVSEYAVESIWVYQQPKDKRWVFDPPEEQLHKVPSWVKFFGYGHTETRPCAMMVGNTYYVHPVVDQYIKKVATKREEEISNSFFSSSFYLPSNSYSQFIPEVRFDDKGFNSMSMFTRNVSDIYNSMIGIVRSAA